MKCFSKIHNPQVLGISRLKKSFIFMKFSDPNANILFLLLTILGRVFALSPVLELLAMAEVQKAAFLPSSSSSSVCSQGSGGCFLGIKRKESTKQILVGNRSTRC